MQQLMYLAGNPIAVAVWAEEPRNQGQMARVGVHSHRRSGTHFTGNMIEQFWDVPWAKSHALKVDAVAKHIKWIHTVRNPVDCIYKNWIWWTKAESSRNPRIREVLLKMDFAQFLAGRAGREFGWQAFEWRGPEGGLRDNLGDMTGYFYDPLRYWADHTRHAILYPHMPVVVYERMINSIDTLVELLTPILGAPKVEPHVIKRPVGHQPHMDIIGSSIQHWPESHLQRLKEELHLPFDGDKSILDHLGFASLEDWIATGADVPLVKPT